MFSTEDGALSVNGLSVFDAVVMVQIIDKSLRMGAIEGPEISCVAVTRSRLVASIFSSTGCNIDLKTENDPKTNPPVPLETTPSLGNSNSKQKYNGSKKHK